MTSASKPEAKPETNVKKSKPRHTNVVAVAEQKASQPPRQVKKQPSDPKPQQKKTENDPIEFDVNTKRIVEAILFAANRAMSVKQIQQIFPELEQPDLSDIEAAIESIIEDYSSRPVGLKKLASGYRFQVKEGLSPWISRLFEEKPPKYSRALLETIAIIAYRQPVTRGEIEEIRGVSVSSNIIRTLLDREWIRVIAHKEVPGRPALYGTTKQFLDYFNLSSLDQLPAMEEIQDLDLTDDAIIQTDQSQREKQEESSQTDSSELKTEAWESDAADGQTGAPENSTLH